MFPTLTGIMAPPSGVIPDNRWGILGIPGTILAARSINRDAAILYVDNAHALANDFNDGTDPQAPLATIAAAVAKCTANRGDVIYVYPTHAETIVAAGGLNINVAGVSILGLGTGENRPTLTFNGNVAASLTVNAPNVLISGLIFKSGIASLTHMVNVIAGKDTWFDTCEFRDSGAFMALIYLDLTGGANTNDRCIVNNCVFRSVVVGSNEAIEIGAVQDRIIVRDCRLYGDFANGGIHSASVLTNVRFDGIEIRNTHAAKWAIQLTAAATGVIKDCRLSSDAAATCLDPGSCMCLGNLGTFAIDTAGVAIPAISGAQVPDVIATRATEALPQAGSKTLFTVNGGPVLVKQIFGTVTTVIGSFANATKLYAGTPGATDLCATLEMNACAADARVSITGTFANAMLKTLTGVPVAEQATKIVVPSGNIGVNCAGSDGGTGRIRWTIVYQPLEAGAYITTP